MRKYLVERTEQTLLERTFFETLEEANRNAWYTWSHLTASEQAKTSIQVGWVEDTHVYFSEDDLKAIPFCWYSFTGYDFDDSCDSYPER